MSNCYSDGELREYMGSEASADAALAAHLTDCASCQARLDELQTVERQVTAQLALLAPQPEPDADVAWRSMRVALQQETNGRGAIAPPRPAKNRRSFMTAILQFGAAQRRLLYGGMATLVALALIVSPGTRALADQLLQTFRVQQTLFVPVSADRIAQLMALGISPNDVVIGKPQLSGGAMQDTTLAAVPKQAGFSPAQVTLLPSQPQSTSLRVSEPATITVAVNVATLRQVLKALNIEDVTLPDALGSGPIRADVAPIVETRYDGRDYTLTLYQGHSPQVTMPEGVDLAQLGKAGLRVLGMSPAEADATSKQIDWASTLVVPFPEGLSNVGVVQIGDSDGLLVSAEDLSQFRASGMPGADHLVLYWQHGDSFYVLDAQGAGMPVGPLLEAARSIK